MDFVHANICLWLNRLQRVHMYMVPFSPVYVHMYILRSSGHVMAETVHLYNGWK